MADLTSESAVIRETAVARLTVIGPRAVERLVAFVDRLETGATARVAALRALEALGETRALDAALRATASADARVAEAAVAVVRVFLRGERGAAALDRLAALVLNRACPETVRLEALTALGDLNPSTLEPLWQALRDDPNAAIRARTGARATPAPGQPQPDVSAEQLANAAEHGLPDDPDALRRCLGTDGTTPLPVLHRIVERIREREALEPPSGRGEWTRTRGTAHVALARRASRLGLYDLREALEGATTPLPVEFLAALSLVGDTSCLDAIAAAHARAADAWWREHLADTFRAIVTRERLTRRHAVMKRIQKRWPAFVVSR